MKYIAVLLTVFNRKEKTLACLGNLAKQQKVEGLQVGVWLVNDGCTDGTPEAVKERFPDVNVIDADGNLYWNRGMYTAWKAAAEARDYDYYLWLNDDSLLIDCALKNMLEASARCKDNAVIVAAMKSKVKGSTTYSGQRNNRMVEPNGTLQECETFNGNCVLVPQSVYKKVGNLDWTFRHAIGDMDYGYRVRKAGFKNFVAPQHLGFCENNPKLPKWARPEIPIKERFKNLYSPLGYAEPLPFFAYERRAFGLAVAIKHFITIHIRVIFPQLWKH